MVERVLHHPASRRAQAVTGVAAMALILAALAVGACTSDKLPSTLEALVPEGVNLAGSVRVDRLLQDADLAALYAASPRKTDEPKTIEEALEQAAAESGIDFSSITQLVFFGVVDQPKAGGEGPERFAFVARGRFQGSVLLSAVAKEIGAQPASERYKGYDLIQAEAAAGGARLVLLSPTVLAWGQADTVRQVVDVAKGDRRAFSGALLDRYRALGDPLLKLSTDVPPEFREAFESGAAVGLPPQGLPLDVEAFTGLRTLSLALDKKNQGFDVTVALGMQTESSAAALGDTLGGMVQLARGSFAEERVRDELRRMQVVTKGTNVTLTYTTTVAALRSLIENPPQGLR